MQRRSLLNNRLQIRQSSSSFFKSCLTFFKNLTLHFVQTNYYLSLTVESMKHFLKPMRKRNLRSSPPLARMAENNDMGKKTLHVEICQKANSLFKAEEIIARVQCLLQKYGKLTLNKNLVFENFHRKSSFIFEYIESIHLSIGQDDVTSIELESLSNIQFYVYRLNEDEGATETMEKDGEEISASTHWILPSKEFNGLWDNLFYGDNIKDQLLTYVETAMTYSERQVNPQIISWNKVVLLHGPPGTGKTSLCKALAQKISIRLNQRFERGQLVEINSHSLFSKWFSESGKLVMNLFNEIRLLLEDPSNLVCILIDEVESLAHARKSCANGSEPSDSVRVVNALLTQLDSLKRHPNVLILTTSNLTEAIDVAFVDRADIKQYIPPPSPLARYQIYFTCIEELMRTNFIKTEAMLNPNMIKISLNNKDEFFNAGPVYELACMSDGLSGRALRKIPFLTHALFQNVKTCSLDEFAISMSRTIRHELESRSKC